MAGRILPVALAAISGIAISVATFGEEFKEQQRRRLQAEYERYAHTPTSYLYDFADIDSDIGAVSALPNAGPSPMASNNIPSPLPEQLPAQTQTAEKAPASSTFGFGAWSSRRRTEHLEKDELPVETTAATPSNKP